MAEKKDLIAEAGMELNDNELEMVTGGWEFTNERNKNRNENTNVTKTIDNNDLIKNSLISIKKLLM